VDAFLENYRADNHHVSLFWDGLFAALAQSIFAPRHQQQSDRIYCAGAMGDIARSRYIDDHLRSAGGFHHLRRAEAVGCLRPFFDATASPTGP